MFYGMVMCIKNQLPINKQTRLEILTNILKMIKGEKMIGADFIYNIYNRIKSYKDDLVYNHHLIKTCLP